ncbi:phage major capsid protein [Mesorhizobium sp.]|uniref:phage major capsid protein n=1 Tax=Mesorhizobium sp. TaxID=1871066 RepID=UPI0025B7DCC5|nr:phage major capsid protein [Mesorhizobium sp.]
MKGTVHITADIDKGMDMARVARVIATGKTAAEREQIAIETGLPDRLREIVKTAVSAGQANGDTWGSQLSNYQIIVTAFLDSLRNNGVFFRLLDGGMLRVPLKSKLTALTASASGYVLGEGSAQKISRLSLENETVDPFRAATIVVITEELANLGALADPLISHELRGGTIAAVDEKFVAILDAAATSSASVGSTVSAVQEDLKLALQALDLGQQSRLYFLANPATVKALATMTIDGGFAFGNVNPVSGGTLLNTPLIPSDQVTFGNFYAIDASGLAGNTDTVTVERFRHSTVQMDDAPDSPASAATITIPLWQRNMTAIVSSCWAGATVVRSNSVYKLTSVDWGSANSP